LLRGARGIFTAEDVENAVGHRHRAIPVTISASARLLCVENTHNLGGGSVWPIAAIRSIATAARDAHLALHLDGARLWHASVATGVSEADYATHFDSVSVCFSKALGAPIGSCLAGTATFTERARRFKQQMGGGMRQAGIVAAGALWALTHHRARIAETHRVARRFADALDSFGGMDVMAPVETNIVRFRLRTVSSGAFVDEVQRHGLLVLPSGAYDVRAVFYLDITEYDADRAAKIAIDAYSRLQ